MIIRATRGFDAGRKLEAAGIPAEGLFFDAEAHAYYVNGRPVLSVTQVLKSVGFIDDTYYTEEGRERGTFVHEACEAVDLGDAPLEDVPDDLRWYVRAWVRFRDEHGFEAEEIEKPRANLTLCYAGTPDRVGRFTRGQWAGRRFVIDFKTGALAKWWRYQLAGYRGMFDAAELEGGLGRMSLRLDPGGIAKPEPYADHVGDWRVFTAALTVAMAKKAR